jgi:hypothetical protein
MTIALRLSPVFCAKTPYELRHPQTGEIRAVGTYELAQICDGDVNELTALADSRRGEWIGFNGYKRGSTLKAYR